MHICDNNATTTTRRLKFKQFFPSLKSALCEFLHCVNFNLVVGIISQINSLNAVFLTERWLKFKHYAQLSFKLDQNSK